MCDSVQRELSELLPFHLNGSLCGDERDRVQRALAADAGLRAELGVLERIRAAVQQDDVSRGPGELGLARLKRDLARKSSARSNAVRASLLVASFAVGAAMSALVLSAFLRSTDTYSQAGAPVAGNSLVVAFRPEATAEQIAQLLLSQSATISDGPSAIGLYRVSIPQDSDAGSVVAALNAAGDVVETAEVAK